MDREKPTISIRVEEAKDFEAIKRLLEEAFLSSPHSDHQEAALVSKLRESASYIKELSLVATKGEEVIGYLMMSKVKVGGEIALALAPLAVCPLSKTKGSARPWSRRPMRRPLC